MKQLVLLGLLSTINTQAVALSQPTTLVSQSQRNLTVNDVRSQLVGQWVVRDQFFIPITIIFTPEEKLYILLPIFDDFQSPKAYEFGYKIINSTTQPMQIDLLDPNRAFLTNGETLQTIFELTNDNRMRVEFIGLRPEESRPTEFTTGSIVLEKVSTITALPRNTSLVNSQSEQTKAKQLEAIQILDAMNRAQQAFFLEKERFTNKIEELEIGISSETEDYRYEILSVSPTNVVMTASAKQYDLKSYASIVAITKDEGGNSTPTTTETCETNESSTAPLTPYVVGILGEDKEVKVECPVGSRLVER